MKRWLVASLLAITLSWNDNSTDELGFHVQKTISGNCVEGWFEVASTGVDIATWVDEMAQPGDCYRVSAYNADAESAYSNTAQVPMPEPDLCTNKNKKGKNCR